MVFSLKFSAAPTNIVKFPKQPQFQRQQTLAVLKLNWRSSSYLGVTPKGDAVWNLSVYRGLTLSCVDHPVPTSQHGAAALILCQRRHNSCEVGLGKIASKTIPTAEISDGREDERREFKKLLGLCQKREVL